RNEDGEARLEVEGLLNEQLVDRSRRGPVTSVAELVRGVADYYVKLHVSSEHLGHPSLDVLRVDEGVSMGLQLVATAVVVFACAAVAASPVGIKGDRAPRARVPFRLPPAALPGVLGPFEPDVAVLGLERLGDRVGAVRALRAVDAPAGN